MADSHQPAMAPAALPQLRIDTLALRLPAGFEQRAARIGRLTAEALAASPPTARAATIAQLQLAPQTVQQHWSDRRIATQLAQAIRLRIDGGL
jgi:hypothetical protein